MLYLGVDQHRKQLTVSVRNEAGDVTLRRQVSTEWARVRAFFDELRRLAQREGGFAAIVEICGCDDWLLKMLTEYGCRETVLIQVEKRSKKWNCHRISAAKFCPLPRADIEDRKIRGTVRHRHPRRARRCLSQARR